MDILSTILRAFLRSGAFSWHTEDEDVLKFELLILAILLFLATGWLSYKEWKYFLWGRMTTAKLVRITERTSLERGAYNRKFLAVDYSFDDEGTLRSETGTASLDSVLPKPGEFVAVEYLPNVPRASRFAGERNTFAVYLFLSFTGFLVFLIYEIAREANAPIKTNRRKS